MQEIFESTRTKETNVVEEVIAIFNNRLPHARWKVFCKQDLFFHVSCWMKGSLICKILLDLGVPLQ
jgi:hypothetical protein